MMPGRATRRRGQQGGLHLLEGLSSGAERRRARARLAGSAQSAEALGAVGSGRLVKVARLRELQGESTICAQDHGHWWEQRSCTC